METTLIPGTAGGTHIANAPLTTDATAQASPSLLRNTIDSRIVAIRPTATPIDQISRLAGARMCGSMEVEYYSVDTRATESAFIKATPNASPDGVENFELEVADPRIFNISETILIVTPTTELGKKQYVGYINKITDRGRLIVIPVGTPWPADGAIPDQSKVVRMGRAAAELDVQTPQFQALPKKDRNNCQIFKMQVEQSTLQKMADKEVAWTFSDQEEVAVIDMRLGMEKSFLFGCKARINDPEKGQDIFTTGGIWNQTDNDYPIGVDNLTQANLIDITMRAFTQNNGSKAKLLLAGSRLVSAISRIAFTDAIVLRETRARWGLEVREIYTNFGRLYLIHSEVFDQCGHEGDGFILDPAYMTKYTHIPFHAEKLDLRRSGTRNTDAVVLTEASCLVLRYPNSHLRIINIA